MKGPSYAEKRDAAISHTNRVAEVEKIAGHPKQWDRYVEKRQKQVKIQKRGKA